MKKIIYIMTALALGVSFVLLAFCIFSVFSEGDFSDLIAVIAVSLLLFVSVFFICKSYVKSNSNEKINNNKKNKFSSFFTTKNITRIAIFSALSIVLYLFIKISIPIFPPWLKLQISDMPAILATFMMNPIAGSIVLVIKTLIKLPFSDTLGVGELADFLIGLSYIIPAYFIYYHKKSIKTAVLGMLVGSLCGTVVAMLSNWLLLIPLYSNVYGFEMLIKMLQSIFSGTTEKTFYNYYIFLSVLPFNLLRFIITSFITFFLYKPLKRLFNSLC